MDLKMDDEIKCAPWNTTRAYVQVTHYLLEIGICLGLWCAQGFAWEVQKVLTPPLYPKSAGVGVEIYVSVIQITRDVLLRYLPS